MIRLVRSAAACLIASVVLACRVSAPAPRTSAEDAATFVSTVNDLMLTLGRQQQQAGWVAATYITSDTQALSARANQAYIDAVARNAKEAARFDDVPLAPEIRRQLDILRTTLSVVTPADAGVADRFVHVAADIPEIAQAAVEHCRIGRIDGRDAGLDAVESRTRR